MGRRKSLIAKQQLKWVSLGKFCFLQSQKIPNIMTHMNEERRIWPSIWKNTKLLEAFE